MANPRSLLGVPSTTLGIVLTAVLLSSCTRKPLLADKVRPDDPTAADARKSQSVYVIEEQGQPLIVDWQPEIRGDLEVAMREGVAVVRFDHKGLKLLTDCKIDGKYGFIGVNTKEQVVSLVSAEEVKANLPGAGLGIIAKLGAELGQKQALNIAIVMVGKRKTTWASAAKTDLHGRCDGATHFVRGATIGAFAMRTGAKGKVSTVAELFGGGFDAHAGSEKHVESADGLLDACKKASPELENPPNQCGALIRLELVKLGTTKKEDKPEATAKVDTAESSCPEGFVFSGGKCARPDVTTTHACQTGDVRDCTMQCEKGNAQSCDTLGYMFSSGTGVTRNDAEAAQLFKRACDAGFANGCFNQGVSLEAGLGVGKNEAGAFPLYEKACGDGSALGCSAASGLLFYGRGVAKDEARSVKLALLACNGGEHQACSNLGVMFNIGMGGVKKNEAMAAKLFKMACDGGNAIGCGNYAYQAEFGLGIAADKKRAGELYAKACAALPSQCIWYGVALQTGTGVKKDGKRAAAEYKKTCEGAVNRGHAETNGESLSCVLMNEFYGGKYGLDVRTVKDSLQSVWLPACQAGHARDCTMIAIVAFSAQQADAKDRMKSACKMGDPWACELAKLPRASK